MTAGFRGMTLHGRVRLSFPRECGNKRDQAGIHERYDNGGNSFSALSDQLDEWAHATAIPVEKSEWNRAEQWFINLLYDQI